MFHRQMAFKTCAILIVSMTGCGSDKEVPKSADEKTNDVGNTRRDEAQITESGSASSVSKTDGNPRNRVSRTKQGQLDLQAKKEFSVDDSDRPGKTNFWQLFERHVKCSLSDFSDERGSTILVAPTYEDQAVPWTKPHDVLLNEQFMKPGNKFVEGYVSFANGSVRYLHIEDGIDIEKFRGFFTYRGGEDLSGSLYPEGHMTSTSEELASRNVRSAMGKAQKKIVLALLRYNDVHGYLPPATCYGPDGKPWHSWRVLILPHLGHGDLYGKYDFSVPWDHPNNAYMLDEMPDVFRHPANKDEAGGNTRYQLATGVGTAFPVMDVDRKVVESIQIKDAQVVRGPYRTGDRVRISYKLVLPADISMNAKQSTESQLMPKPIGVRQHWVERIGGNKLIPSLQKRQVGKRGNQYAAGGSMITEIEILTSGVLPVDHQLNSQDYPPGKYACHIEYKLLHHVFKSETVVFEIVD